MRKLILAVCALASLAAVSGQAQAAYQCKYVHVSGGHYVYVCGQF